MIAMKNIDKPIRSLSNNKILKSQSELEIFFIHSLQEMYEAECVIEEEFGKIENKILSPNLHDILKRHFAIHLRHMVRMRKIFQLEGETVTRKKCESINAILSEAISHLYLFSDDIANWEIALILVSQKLAHLKIASYSGLAHLAIKLKHYEAATLFAICVQEEEEFIVNNLNGIINEFLASHIDGYKK